MPLKIVFLRPPKLVSTKTLLLKHYYRRQGQDGRVCPTVPEGHKHRVTTPENLGKSRGPPQNPAETP